MNTLTPSNIIGEGITLLECAPDPRGPHTLQEDLYMSEFALQIHKQVSCGNGFIAPEVHGNMTRKAQELTTRLDLTMEAHPELKGMYQQHTDLLKRLREAKTSNPSEITSLEQECSQLATQIVEIERSVDVG